MPAHISLVNICGWIAQLIQDLYWKHSLFWNYRNCWAQGVYSCIFWVSFFLGPPSGGLLRVESFFFYQKLLFVICLFLWNTLHLELVGIPPLSIFMPMGWKKKPVNLTLWRNNSSSILWRSWLEREYLIRKLSPCINYRQLREYHGYLQMVLPTCLTQNGMVCLCREMSSPSKEGAWLTILAKIPPRAARITTLGEEWPFKYSA